jgi:hypothetical protein
MEISFSMVEGKCYCCSKGYCQSPVCHLKDKTQKEDWAINKAKAEETSKQQ